MLIPVRCFTCSRIVGNKWELYKKLTEEGMSNKEALDQLGLEMYCCRRMLLGHIDLVDQLVK